MSDYIERLRGELLRAEAAQRRRVRVGPVLRPLAAVAVAAAVIAVVVTAWPSRTDEREVTGTTVTYRVGHLGESIARTMRARLHAYGVPEARVEVSGETMSISAPVDVAPLTRGGNLNLFDFEATRIGGPEPVTLEQAQARNGIPVRTEDGKGYYALRDQVALGSRDVKSAFASQDPMTGAPSVVVELTPDGQQRFHELTRAIARRGADERELQHLAIVIDGQVISLASIDWRQAPDGIEGAGFGISRPMTPEQAKQLAAILSGGAIPIELKPG
jgi:SecD/SecF fusion protein